MGTQGTKEFYDSEGWHKIETGNTVDGDLFGVKEDGPLRQAMFGRMWRRMRDYVAHEAGGHVLEVGCGGSPEARLLDHFGRYTGSDFSQTGLDVARDRLAAFKDCADFVEADAVALPFADAQFDTVYSAHMLYHIEDPAAQAKAMSEMMRVLRPGGSLILSIANPRPILFPARAAIRIVAETPVLNTLARRIKGPSPIPYNPQKLRWYMAQCAALSDVRMISGGIASTKFNQSVTELSGVGKAIWTAFDRLDRHAPTAAARMGNYAVIMGRK